MFKLHTFNIVPALPEPLKRLRDLALNLWWTWHADAKDLFRRLEPDLWRQVGQNPVQLLAHMSQKRLDQIASDTAYIAHMNRVLAALDDYMGRKTWFDREFGDQVDTRIGYLSMEFGLHECLPIYSGGLGILAGDHLKSASDLGLPLVGVGLLYRQGYFQQRLSPDGWQLEAYPSADFYQLPLQVIHDREGNDIRIRIPMGDHEMAFGAWRTQVGRVPLFLLDADIPENTPRDRDLTHRLYGGDEEMRIRQEILLGIGGLRLLEALEMTPTVAHVNEGHAAFMTIERIRQRMQHDEMDFGEAREATAPSNIFTTHTPVPAGIDTFKPQLVAKYISPYLSAVGLSLDDFMALGRWDGGNKDEPFCMAILALRLCAQANGVSALHGHVSREMWKNVWPGAPRDEVPITSITNGIHTTSWIAPDMAELLDRYLGPSWQDTPENHDIWRRADEIPDVEFWQVHERQRLSLVSFARQHLREQLRRRGAAPSEVKAAEEALDPAALTIGFARRFAPYKRGGLIFRDAARLLKIISDPERPVQLVFAGKAHPRDDRGKEVIKKIFTHIQKPEYRRRIVFLENYDISVARSLVQGVDVWLNNPIKPREASGTSGMKVPANGGINMSILDGWWPEAYDGHNGWAIEDGRIMDDDEYRDHLESEAIYDLLEKEVVPLFYDRGADGIPRGWIARAKASMRTVCPMFSTHRMIEEYTRRLYVPAGRSWQKLAGESFEPAKRLAHWKRAVHGKWSQVAIDEVQADDGGELAVGGEVTVRAQVRLGDISPDDVAVELYYGRVNPQGELVEGQAAPMACAESLDHGTYQFVGKIPCQRSGQHGYAVRVVPRHADLVHRHDTGLIYWS